jgi:hypothetical protein
MTMAEDLLLVAGVLVASVLCGWYVVQAIPVAPVPAEDMCTAVECVALAFGQ